MSDLVKTYRRETFKLAAMPDLDRILDFITSNARLLDRRRAELAVGDGDPEAALAVLAGYRNADGGFGWALEPDLRAPSSQPVAALHAFEVLEEVAPVTSPLAVGAARLARRRRAARRGAAVRAPRDRERGLGADVGVRRHDVALAAHDRRGAGDRAPGRAPRSGGGGPPVARPRHGAGRRSEIAALDGPRHAIEFRYVLALLDALDARDELERLGAHLPADGTMAVTGGKPDEAMRPLDFSPEPGRPLRALLDPGAIEADLDRLEAEQHDDGGWDVDWAHWSPAGGLEWRGWATVRALRILRANGRV